MFEGVASIRNPLKEKEKINNLVGEKEVVEIVS